MLFVYITTMHKVFICQISGLEEEKNHSINNAILSKHAPTYLCEYLQFRF